YVGISPRGPRGEALCSLNHPACGSRPLSAAAPGQEERKKKEVDPTAERRQMRDETKSHAEGAHAETKLSQRRAWRMWLEDRWGCPLENTPGAELSSCSARRVLKRCGVLWQMKALVEPARQS